MKSTITDAKSGASSVTPKSDRLSRSKWMAALSAASIDTRDDQDALTIDAYAEMFTVSKMTAARHLRALVKKGLAIETRKRMKDAKGACNSYVAFRLR